MKRGIPVLLAAALLAAACAAPPELTGGAAARSRGAAVETGGPDGPGESAAPGKPVDPWLDDARDLARVNGRVITLREVRHAMGPAYDQYLDRREDLARFVNARVRDLVIRRLVVEEARRVGLEVTDEDMARDEERQAKAAAKAGDTIEQNLRDRGMTRREWDDDRREEIYYQKALWYFTGQFPDHAYAEDRFRPSVDFYVGPEEVRRWGERHRPAIERPDSAMLRILDVRADDFGGPGAGEEEAWVLCAKAVDALVERIRAGESFADLAREASRGPEAADGGLRGPVYRDSPLLSEFKEWAFREGRRDGDVSGRIRRPTGFVILYMEKREEARVPPIEEWGPPVRARLEALRKQLAWTDVQVRLLEEAAVSPPAVRSSILALAREQRRGILDELE